MGGELQMNKMIKGSVAGATGIVLLMGGFGTYALWSDTSSMEANGVTSGELDIASATATWADASGDSTTAWNPASDAIVPGDVIERTQVFTVTGSGKNLEGTIDLTGGAVDKAAFAKSPGPGNWLTVDVDVTSSGGGVNETAPGSNAFVFSAPFDTETLTAVVTYSFDEATTAQQAQDATATMAATTFTIAQVRP